MKKLRLLFFCLLSILIAFPANAQNRKRIAILPFSGLEQYQTVKLTIQNYLTELFTSKKKLDVVERTDLERILEEQQLGQSGIISESSAIQVGQLLGADFLLLGSLTEVNLVLNGTDPYGNRSYKGKVGVTLKIVDTETGTIVGSLSESSISHRSSYGDYEQLVLSAAEDLVTYHLRYQLWNLFPVAGYIVQLKGRRDNKTIALIDLGSEMGVRRGDKFMVFRRGESIVHPVTGKQLPGKIYELGEAKVIEADDVTAAVEIKTEYQIKTGDGVKSKEKKPSFWEDLVTGH